MLTRDEFVHASARGRRRLRVGPVAIGADYDPRTRCVEIELNTGLTVSFHASDAHGLEAATPRELRRIEISPSGLGLHFPLLDADLYLPALLEGFLGTRRWAAARMGHRGGSAKSVAKAAAARRNGRLGGRPRKQTEGRGLRKHSL